MNLDLDKPPRAMVQEMGESFGKLRAYDGPHFAAVDSERRRAKRRRGGNLARGLAARRANHRELMAGILYALQGEDFAEAARREAPKKRDML